MMKRTRRLPAIASSGEAGGHLFLIGEACKIDYNYIIILLNFVPLHPTVDNCQYQSVNHKNIKPFSGKFRRSYRG